jgi:hypothetical protein
LREGAVTASLGGVDSYHHGTTINQTKDYEGVGQHDYCWDFQVQIRIWKEFKEQDELECISIKRQQQQGV